MPFIKSKAQSNSRNECEITKKKSTLRWFIFKTSGLKIQKKNFDANIESDVCQHGSMSMPKMLPNSRWKTFSGESCPFCFCLFVCHSGFLHLGYLGHFLTSSFFTFIHLFYAFRFSLVFHLIFSQYSISIYFFITAAWTCVISTFGILSSCPRPAGLTIYDILYYYSNLLFGLVCGFGLLEPNWNPASYLVIPCPSTHLLFVDLSCDLTLVPFLRYRVRIPYQRVSPIKSSASPVIFKCHHFDVFLFSSLWFAQIVTT